MNQGHIRQDFRPLVLSIRNVAETWPPVTTAKWKPDPRFG